MDNSKSRSSRSTGVPPYERNHNSMNKYQLASGTQWGGDTLHEELQSLWDSTSLVDDNDQAISGRRFERLTSDAQMYGISGRRLERLTSDAQMYAKSRTKETLKNTDPEPTGNPVSESGSKRNIRNPQEHANRGVPHDTAARISDTPTDGLAATSNPTMTKVHAEVPLSDTTLQDAVAFFGDHIIALMRSKKWFESATLFHRPDFISRKIGIALTGLLPSNLERLDMIGASTREKSHPSQQKPIEFRRRLAHYTCINAQKRYLAHANQEDAAEGPVAYTVPPNVLRTIQKLGMCDCIKDDIVSDDHSFDYSDNHVFRKSLFSSFCLTLQRILYDTNSPILSHIKAMVSNKFTRVPSPGIQESDVDASFRSTEPNPLPSITIHTDWRPWEFLDNQFGETVPPITSIVTYTGFVESAFAATCLDYVNTFWPSTGPMFLRVLQQLIDSWDPNLERTIVTDETENIQLSMTLSEEGCLSVRGTSSVETLTYIAQQTVWICSALRLSPVADTVFHCDGDISEHEESNQDGPSRSFYVSCQLQPTPPEHHSCWREIVDQTAVLCQHFPIPPRQNEVGLEVSLEMLCAMAGIRHAVDFDGGIVMKSLHGMLVPLSLQKSIVQWHYVYAEDDSQRFTYQQGIAKCSRRALTDSVDFETLRSTRAIVGWCRDARKIIGRDDAVYSTIGYSTAKPFSSSVKFSGGALGFQQFGAAQVNFTLGPKDTKIFYQRSGQFRDILKYAARSHVLLQDTEEKRAWLVNADDVILHIVQTRLCQDHESAGSPTLLKYLDTASRTLGSNENWHALGSNKTVNAMVDNIWSMLEMLLDQSIRFNQTQDRAIKMPFQKTLVGFEFMGVVEERSPLETKEYSAKNSSGGWTRLVKDTDTLVLFAQGFQDLIESSHTRSDCFPWRRMPKGEDYLGTTVSVLKDLYNVAGSRSDHRHLTSSGLYWRSERSAFGPCLEPQVQLCRCNRLQDISHSDSRPNAAPELEADGGVVFGKPTSYSAPQGDCDQASVKKLSSSKSKNPNTQTLDTHPKTTIPLPGSNADESQEEDSPGEEAEGSHPGGKEPGRDVDLAIAAILEGIPSKTKEKKKARKY
ncbi:uncharacterized protein B0J16DRAFT_365785 [Fusarium flagelliforme]|uniref:Pfs domain protein n=1 Tax=Fusarium flagelliforme TaxID=2675880 RepID=A0A395N137_9HYPO|nr:uncharacterized protein B0J16DRAFT_365785 [Fusarium flagelliforme]KAH7196444.1 hypothetical protein B0J16DRAFT_365785 [Fusarium flagelliforme]RFN53851.1 pfs domain protein [Fusarium flagelliforme]